MYTFNEVKVGMLLEVDGAPYEVVKVQHSKMGRGGAILRTTLKNLLTQAQAERTFHGDEKFPPASVTTKPAQFLYQQGDGLVFMDNETFDQFNLPLKDFSFVAQYIKPGATVELVRYQDKPINVSLPLKVTLTVVEAPPGIRGDSATTPSKEIVTDTGLKLRAPLFINVGDDIIVDTRSGSYVEKAK
jgi:elongation factor P